MEWSLYWQLMEFQDCRHVGFNILQFSSMIILNVCLRDKLMKPICRSAEIKITTSDAGRMFLI